MTSIQKLRDEKKKKEEEMAFKTMDESLLIFKKQKSSIQALIKLPGYKTIKDFWRLQEKQATIDLRNVKFTDLQEFGRVQSKAQVSSKFVQFLDNLEG